MPAFPVEESKGEEQHAINLHMGNVSVRKTVIKRACKGQTKYIKGFREAHAVGGYSLRVGMKQTWKQKMTPGQPRCLPCHSL